LGIGIIGMVVVMRKRIAQERLPSK
jgi:hypothetical protein